MQKKEDATELQGKSVALKKQTEEAEVIKNELESKRDKTMVVIGMTPCQLTMMRYAMVTDHYVHTLNIVFQIL